MRTIKLFGLTLTALTTALGTTLAATTTGHAQGRLPHAHGQDRHPLPGRRRHRHARTAGRRPAQPQMGTDHRGREHRRRRRQYRCGWCRQGTARWLHPDGHLARAGRDQCLPLQGHAVRSDTLDLDRAVGDRPLCARDAQSPSKARPSRTWSRAPRPLPERSLRRRPASARSAISPPCSSKCWPASGPRRCPIAGLVRR